MPTGQGPRTKGRPGLLRCLLVLSLTLILLVPACSKTDKDERGGDKLQLIATIFPPYDFARRLGGEAVEVTMLLPPGSESHSYEPSPKDLVRIAECDLFIYNGGVSDSWVDRLLEAAEIDPGKAVRMMDFVELLEESHEGILDHDHDHDEDPVPHLHAYDEHIWTSPKNALLISQGIADRLAVLDPDRAPFYRDRFDLYRQDLEDLDRTFQQIVEGAKRREIIVADRFPLIYFTTDYGLDYTAAFPGCAAETDPKPRTVAAMIDRVREEEIPYIFHIEFSDERLADLIVEETGARKLLFHTCHNVSKDDLAGGATYLSLMGRNADNLRKALNE